MAGESQNTYLDQVLHEQSVLEKNLRVQKQASPQQARQRIAAPAQAAQVGTDSRGGDGGGAGGGPQGPAVDVRITGFWRWKNVIVPPNAYVVHTRRGVPEPIHCGLGISFEFDPLTDSFLVVPAAMQTILINARSIVRERQGILIQGYVQWIIQDFKTAYRKLDFSDLIDPMRVVNLQLREQAEAAIKDKVATLSVDEVLADKQPIIRELTARLKHVAEGDGGGEGLGLRIVTVQIKEAVVSSSRLWETLQRPFRAERSKEARLAELASESVVRRREAEEEKARATDQIETEGEIARRRAESEAEAFDRELKERARRAKVEAETLAQTTAFEIERTKRLAELGQARVEGELAEQALRDDAAHRLAERAVALDGARRKVENDLSAAAVQARLVDALPDIAWRLPRPEKLETVSIGADGVTALVQGLKQVVGAARS